MESVEWTHDYIYSDIRPVSVYNIYNDRKIFWLDDILIVNRSMGINYESNVYNKKIDLPKLSYLDVIQHKTAKKRLLITNIRFDYKNTMFCCLDIDCHIAAISHYNILNSEVDEYELIAFYDFKKDEYKFLKEYSKEEQNKIYRKACL